MRFVADTLRLGERLNGAGRGVRPKGVHQSDLVSLEEAPGGGAARGRRSLKRPSGRQPARRRLLRLSESRRRAVAAGAAADADEQEEGRGGRRGQGADRGHEGRSRSGARRRRPRRARSQARTQRTPARSRAPAKRRLPDVKKEILVSVEVAEQRVAVLEDGKVAEVYLGGPAHRSIAGNIYKGVVDNVLPGMEARSSTSASRRTASSTWTRSSSPSSRASAHGRRIQELIKRGQEVLVQAVKDPMGTKGARLTTEISLPGPLPRLRPVRRRHRRLAPARGRRARAAEGDLQGARAARGRAHRPHRGRGRLRGGARGRPRPPAEALVDDPGPRQARGGAGARLPGGGAPAPHRPRPLHPRLRARRRRPRAHLPADRRLPEAHVARARRAGRALHAARSRCMERSGVDEAVRSTLNRRVDLPSGGYLDLRLRRGVHRHRREHGPLRRLPRQDERRRLEDTITKNNLEAVGEVVRQLRLRDIGGIIVIDFIDMANPKNRQLVEEALERELERDRTKTYVVEISPLGLVEMTRQNVTDGPREILTDRCPTCKGDGVVVSMETHAVDAERQAPPASSPARRAESFLIELNSRSRRCSSAPAARASTELEKETGRRFASRAKPACARTTTSRCSRRARQPTSSRGGARPAGQELEVELEARTCTPRRTRSPASTATSSPSPAQPRTWARRPRSHRGRRATSVAARRPSREEPAQAATGARREAEEEDAPRVAAAGRGRRGSRGGAAAAADGDADAADPSRRSRSRPRTSPRRPPRPPRPSANGDGTPRPRSRRRRRAAGTAPRRPRTQDEAGQPTAQPSRLRPRRTPG